jgi:hypothetical protein
MVVVEALLYAAFLTMVVSRRLLALVGRRLAAMADRIPEQRWAAAFVSVEHGLMTAATHPLGAVRLLLHRLERVPLHEAVDPNAARHGLHSRSNTALTVFTPWPARHETLAGSRG